MSRTVNSSKPELTAQQNIPLFDHLLIHRGLILTRQFVRRNDPADLVDSTCDPSAGDKSRKIPIHEGLTDPETPAHPLKCQAAITLQ